MSIPSNKRAVAFAEAFYFYVGKEGGFEKGILLNENI